MNNLKNQNDITYPDNFVLDGFSDKSDTPKRVRGL